MTKFINFRVIFKVLGVLLLSESLFMSLGGFVSLIYTDVDPDPYTKEIFQATLITAAVGLASWLLNRNSSSELGKREGYIIVSLVWVVFSLFGALPYYISGTAPTFTDAFFETMSGFTTTGASILNDIPCLGHGLLFWRSMTQWLGGMGIIVLSLIFLPLLGIGGMQLFIAEVPGPTPDKLHPRVRETAKRLWAIYLIFTIAQTLLLWLGEMDFYDSINHALTTMATGGYSTKGDSCVSFSAYSQYIIIIFMIIAGTNFTLSYFAFHLDFKKVWKNEEFKNYLIIIGLFTLVIGIGLIAQFSLSIEEAFRQSLFQVASIITTTGYASADYEIWLPFMSMLIFTLMFFGGSAGSTGGGIKIIRIVVLMKNSFMEFKRLIHPHAIIPVRLNRMVVSPSVTNNVYAFVAIYFFVFLSGVIAMSILGYELDTSVGSVATSLGNIGPGIGSVGPMENFAHLNIGAKWLLSFMMLIGRLELFTVLVLFSPALWKR